jgi:hypothetical protein
VAHCEHRTRCKGMQPFRIKLRSRHLDRLNGLARIAAWSAVCAIAVLSLLPAGQMTRTYAGGHMEHVFAYSVATLLVTVAYVEHIARTVLALLMYAGVLEFLQCFSPQRTSTLVDFIFSGFGVLLGGLAFLAIRTFLEISRD